MFAPNSSSSFAYFLMAFNDTTKLSSLITVPPALADNPSKVDLHNLSISPVAELVTNSGAFCFNLFAFFPCLLYTSPSPRD